MSKLSDCTFEFVGEGGRTEAITVACRRLPEQVERVTQTLQLDVDELFEQLLTWGGDEEEEEEEAAPPAGTGAPGSAGTAASSSKKICGNVAEDQPDLIGLDVWPAAITLSKYLAAHPHLAAGATVMELGAGMGLPGLLCAKLGAAQVLLTDYEQVVVDQLRHNVALNGVQQRCSYLALDWFDLSPLQPQHRQAQQLLLLADVIYAAAVVEGLVGTMQAVLHPQGVALVAHRIRRPLIFDRREKIAKLQERDEIFEAFKRQCMAAGFHLRELTTGSSYEAGKEPLLLAVSADVQRLQQLEAAEAADAEPAPA